jgi:ammonium transporter, Amt family
VSAACDAFDAPLALAVGAVGGAVMTAADALLERVRIDDAVSAVPIHLAAGIWGTLAAVAAPTSAAFGARLLRQLEGIGAGAAWGFLVPFLLLKVLGRVVRLRVSADAELVGLNVSEHQAATELMDVGDALEETARRDHGPVAAPAEPLGALAQLFFDRQGFVAYGNSAASAMFGYDEHELRTLSLTQLFAAVRDVPPSVESIREQYGAEPREARGLRRTGEEFPMEVSLRVAGPAGGDEPIEAATFKDITARKEAEEGLSRTQADIHRRLDRELEATGRVVKSGALPPEHRFRGGEVAMHVASGDAGDWFGYYWDPTGQLITLYAGDPLSQGTTTAALLSAVVAGADYAADYTHGLLLGDGRYPAERQLRNLADVVNRIVVQAGKGETQVSMAFLHLDLRTGEVTFLSAGRKTPFLLKLQNTMRELSGGGTALGISSDPEFDLKKSFLTPGDVVVMHSDGLVDAFGPEGKVLHAKELKRVVASRDHVKDTRDEILARARSVWKESTDEVCSVLVLKWNPDAGEPAPPPPPPASGA